MVTRLHCLDLIQEKKKKIRFVTKYDSLQYVIIIIIIVTMFTGCWHMAEHHMSNGKPPPGRYGEYSCDSPWALLESAANTMRAKQGDNVEFVLWTG